MPTIFGLFKVFIRSLLTFDGPILTFFDMFATFYLLASIQAINFQSIQVNSGYEMFNLERHSYLYTFKLIIPYGIDRKLKLVINILTLNYMQNKHKINLFQAFDIIYYVCIF